MRITSIKIKVYILLQFIILLVLSSCNKKSAENQDSALREENISNINDSITEKPRIYLENIYANWFDGNSKFWYKCIRPNGNLEFILVNAKTGEKKVAFDHEKVAMLIGKDSKAESLPISKLKFLEGTQKIQLISEKGSSWIYEKSSNTLEKVTEGKSATNKKNPESKILQSVNNGDKPNDTIITKHKRTKTLPVNNQTVISPDGKKEAFVKNNNLWLRDLETKLEVQLSTDGLSDYSYHRDAIRLRAIKRWYNHPDFPKTLPEVYWSPDSKNLIAIRTKVVPEPRVYLTGMNPIFQYQTYAESYPYLRPGDEIPTQEIHLFGVQQAKEVKLDQALWNNPWEVKDFIWDQESNNFRFLYIKRGFQLLRLIKVSTKSKKAKVILEEKSNTFIDVSKFSVSPLKNGKEILMMSERDGWNHLYVFDAVNGGPMRQITEGKWVVRSIESIDEKAGLIWFWAAGVNMDEDPYYLHLGKAKIDGSGWKIVTSGNGTHTVAWSPDRKYLIDTWSRVDLPPVHVLRDSENGKLICQLEKADATELLNKGFRFPKPFVSKGRDDNTDIYGVIHYPYNFNTEDKYPIIEHIYSGPHVAIVPKKFSNYYERAEILNRNGYVVVQIDGMGTNWRSKAFHDVAWKNLKDAGFPDRILWIKAAAAKHPWMDTTRVGIYGCSAGGQSAMRAVLDYSYFYKAAAADCGCHDNRLDKIRWNEQWMGWPVDSSYAACSNIDDAYKLGGELLLTVGELDKNVDPSCTYKVIEALFEAGKEFEYLTIPDEGHGAWFNYPEAEELRVSFFNKHLKTNF